MCNYFKTPGYDLMITLLSKGYVETSKYCYYFEHTPNRDDSGYRWLCLCRRPLCAPESKPQRRYFMIAGLMHRYFVSCEHNLPLYHAFQHMLHSIGFERGEY